MPIEKPPTADIFRMAVMFEGGMAIAAVLLARLIGLEPSLSRQTPVTAPSVGWGLAAAAPMLLALVVLTHYPLGPFRGLQQIVRDLLVPLFRQCTVWELLAISALAGVGEEWLFRGVLQQGITQYSHQPWLALIVSSLLFGLAHSLSLAYALVATLISLYFGWLLWQTDSLLVPIIAHAAYDFGALVYLLRRERTS